MTERPAESEPTVRASAAWIDDEMRADSPVWDTIERFGIGSDPSRFKSLALIMPPNGYDVEPNYLTNNEYSEFIRFEVAGDDGTEPIRKTLNECNRAWQEMAIHMRAGFEPDRARGESPRILEELVEPLNRESILFGLGLTLYWQFLPDRETSQAFDNICAEFDLIAVEQRGLARLTAKLRPDETLRYVLLNPDGKYAEHLCGPDGRPDADRFGGPEALERCKAETLTRLVKHGDGDPVELEARLRRFYPELMDPASDTSELREKLAETWWEKIMLLTAGMMNRGDNRTELAEPLIERIDQAAALARIRTDIEGVIADPPPSPRRGPLNHHFLGPWQPREKAAKALVRFNEMFPKAVS